MFLLIPFFLWLIGYSLSSAEHFANYSAVLHAFITRFIIWVLLSALVYHLIAGIRHLLWDIHIGDSLKVGRASAFFVMALSVVLILGMGYFLLIWA